MTILVGDKIKLNNELCPVENQGNPEFQFGKLGYFALMLEWELEVLTTFNHSFHGEMITCKVLNVPEVECDVVFRMEDVVKVGASKFNIDFEILSTVKANQPKIDELQAKEKQLVNYRSLQKLAGSKIADHNMKQNWQQITKVREEIKKELAKPESALKVKTKHGIFLLEKTGETETDKIIQKLRSIIRTQRKERKEIKTVRKEIAGNMAFEMVGKVMSKPAQIVALNEKFAINVIKEHKKPTTNDNYVGIEIEMLSPKSIEDMNKEFIKARLHRVVNVGTDGSIRTDQDGSKAMELRILLKESELETKLKEICDVLRKNDCYANRSCGMHVHLDMRNRDAELAYSNLFKLQEIMFASQPLSRRNNSYCKKNKTAKLKLSEFDSQERYSAINTVSYNKHRTIEIRLHEGATKFKDIYNWTKFLVDTVNQSAKIKDSIDSVQKLQDLGFYDQKIINHFENRLEEYSA